MLLLLLLLTLDHHPTGNPDTVQDMYERIELMGLAIETAYNQTSIDHDPSVLKVCHVMCTYYTTPSPQHPNTTTPPRPAGCTRAPTKKLHLTQS